MLSPKMFDRFHNFVQRLSDEYQFKVVICSRGLADLKRDMSVRLTVFKYGPVRDVRV